jgi:hypothetical protein
MYMVREVYQAKRGKAPEVVAAFKAVDRWCERAGYTNRRIYVDYDGPMDTVVHQYELESLDQYFATARQAMADPDMKTRAFNDAFNDNTTAGRREIYEVIQ